MLLASVDSDASCVGCDRTDSFALFDPFDPFPRGDAISAAIRSHWAIPTVILIDRIAIPQMRRASQTLGLSRLPNSVFIRR